MEVTSIIPELLRRSQLRVFGSRFPPSPDYCTVSSKGIQEGKGRENFKFSFSF